MLITEQSFFQAGSAVIAVLLSALGVTQHRRISKLEDDSITSKECTKCSLNLNNQLKAIHESVIRSERISLTVLKNMSRSRDHKDVDIFDEGEPSNGH
jgi:hypothetical protein